MTHPLPSAGLLKKVWLWLHDTVRLPGRLRQLAEAKEAERDPRPVCRACGKGRVPLQVTEMERGSIAYWHYGQCDACDTWFELQPDPLRIVSRRVPVAHR